MNYRFLTIFLLISVLAFTGCAANNSAEQLEIVDAESGFDMPKNEWSTPFWERSPDREKIREYVSEITSTQAVKDQRLANLAIIGDLPTDEKTLEKQATKYGFRLIGKRRLREALNQVDACQRALSMACAEALAAWPGARLVIVVEDGQATVLDPSSGAEYGATPVADGEALIGLAADRSELGPWAMRSFRGDDGQLYLAAGEANGLQQGQILAVHDQGRLVRSPGGLPIAWRPGGKVGEVRISALLGPSLSALERVNGDTLTRGHVLLMEE